MRTALLASLTIVGLGVLQALPARAHIDLLEPEARAHGTAAFGDTDVDVNSSIKNAPCGQATTGRSERVARYAPGQTIRVRVREENAHESYLRVALDLDGDDFPLRAQFPGGPETQEQAEAAEAALGAEWLLLVQREDNDTAGFVHELMVTLPDVTCDNCTLQVLQYMYDDPAAPYYFQCADLVIADEAAPDAGAGGADAGPGSPSSPPAAMSAPTGATDAPGAAAPAAPSTPSPSTGNTAPSGSSEPDDGAATAPVRASASDGGSCSASGPPRTSALGVGVGLAPVLLGLALLVRRSRRARR